MAPNYPTPSLQLVKGEGARVTDSEGRTYTDLLAGIAVSSLGHAHPALVQAVCAQVAQLAHTSNLYANAPSLRLAERLQERTRAFSPGHKVIFQNSGTEANEAALKLVRRHAHTQGMPDAVVLAFENSFHGRTAGAVRLTGQAHYQEGFTPLPAQIAHVPFNDPAALEQAFAQHRVAGVFFESVQGEGGVVPMAPDAARTMKRLCADHDALLVADEIQTGVGRTGRFFGFEHDGLAPDAITLAKGLGGGLPIAALLVRPDRASLLPAGAHGSTFGGNPVACAAGNAVLDVLEAEGLAARAATLGAAFQAALAEAGVHSRGRGLLLGLPLPGPTAPDAVKAMREEGYLVGQA
ncbi:MAG TPA: aminotransferase class III-fold pyridoxal phosphate-dependent enzyme, partial [Candidatus Thermoplasmatota archaeon]|nr:aminotransferase class III-fold pyridoxal phosphate-dependent enzyme [Candidatus Thermoplasmatota archaeon]